LSWCHDRFVVVLPFPGGQPGNLFPGPCGASFCGPCSSVKKTVDDYSKIEIGKNIQLKNRSLAKLKFWKNDEWESILLMAL